MHLIKLKNLPRNNGLREEITNNVYVAEKEKKRGFKSNKF